MLKTDPPDPDAKYYWLVNGDKIKAAVKYVKRGMSVRKATLNHDVLESKINQNKIKTTKIVLGDANKDKQKQLR